MENRLPGADANPVPGHRRQPAVRLHRHGRRPRTQRRRSKGRAYERRNLRLPITIEEALSQMEECETVEPLPGQQVRCAAMSRSNAPSTRTSSG